jgi:hypothetical protein
MRIAGYSVIDRFHPARSRSIAHMFERRQAARLVSRNDDCGLGLSYA